jgi:hypothetical protein
MASNMLVHESLVPYGKVSWWGFYYPMDPAHCYHCGTELTTSRERAMLVCYECRRTALLTGYWPEDLPISKHSSEQPKPSFQPPGLIH